MNEIDVYAAAFERKDLERCAALLKVMEFVAEGWTDYEQFPFSIRSLLASDIVSMCNPAYAAKVLKVKAELFPEPEAAMSAAEERMMSEDEENVALSILRNALE